MRRLRYGANIRRARSTVVGSDHIARDVERVYPRRGGEIAVIPLAPSELPAPDAEDRRWAGTLPDSFALYPAAAWPHKNHEVLFRALALLQSHGIRIPLVLTGATAGSVDLSTLACEHGIDDLVRHLGFVTPSQLSALYEKSRLTVIPTLYEAGSFPMFEAFSKGSPVVASAVCSLPSQASGAAILIDPGNEYELADRLKQVWSDDSLRCVLRQAGLRRAGEFTWPSTATGYVAAYRRALCLPPTESDIAWQANHARF